jgi:hypothetical protein
MNVLHDLKEYLDECDYLVIVAAKLQLETKVLVRLNREGNVR